MAQANRQQVRFFFLHHPIVPHLGVLPLLGLAGAGLQGLYHSSCFSSVCAPDLCLLVCRNSGGLGCGFKPLFSNKRPTGVSCKGHAGLKLAECELVVGKGITQDSIVVARGQKPMRLLPRSCESEEAFFSYQRSCMSTSHTQ